MSQRKRTGGESKRKSAVDGVAESRALSENEAALADVLKWLLDEVNNNAIPLRRDCRWTTPVLIAIAILWVWVDEPTLTGRYARSLKIGRRLGRAVPKISYQAFIKRLGRHTAAALGLLKPLLRSRMKQSLASNFLLAGFALFGVDGSRFALPRTESNEARFSPGSSRGKRGRKRETPEATGRGSRNGTDGLPLAGPEREEESTAAGVASDRRA